MTYEQIVQLHFQTQDCGLCPLGGGILAAIDRNSFAISVKFGLSDGSDDQQLSINDLQSGSHDPGTAGRSVLLTIPPETMMAGYKL